ncbi:MAG: hypothetical protein AAGD11_05215 [Planctomycetota bacterium]
MLNAPLLLAQAAAGSTASGLLMGLDGEQRFVVMLVAIGCGTGALIAITAIITGVYTSLVARRELNDLKQDMLDRGMSSQEIAEVIEATPVADAASRFVKAKFGRKG